MSYSINQHFISSCEQEKKFFLGWNLYIHNKITRSSDQNRIALSIGSAHLLDYETSNLNDDIVLIIPSLINKYYILDLSKNYSLVKYLKSLNYRVMIVEWCDPISNEYSFNLNDYVKERIIPIINFIQEKFHKKIILLGHCLGGTLALITSSIMKEEIKGIILIATPWDFSQITYLNSCFLKFSSPLVLPAQIKNFFYALDYEKNIQKFVNFLSFKQNSNLYKKFITVESWLDNGIAVTKKVFENIYDLSKKNAINSYNQKIEILLNENQNNNVAKLVIICSKDKIVPINSSLPLTQMNNVTSLILDTGHIGVLINNNSKSKLYKAIKTWQRALRE